MAIQLGIIKAVLESDDSPTRFERFCIELYSEAEGIELLATSRTWDLGRDARSLAIAGGKYRAILCATLEKDIDEKVKSDISYLTKTSLTQTLIYCSSKPLSEAKCGEIESVIRQLYSSVESVQVLGQNQLTSLAERHEDVLRKHYGAEINSIQLAIESPRVAPEAKEVGLRLALLTHSSDDATALKKELAEHLILDTLSNKGSLTPEQIAGGITSLLHLPRTISTNYTRELTKDLEVAGFVVFDNGKVALTEPGMESAKSIPEEASTKLLEGRIAVRDAIKKLSGHVLTESQFEELWNAFQDGMTDLFYSHGLAIVKMIRSALAEERWTSEKSKLEIPLGDFAERVVRVIKEQQLREEVRQAIMDMFFERDSAAFEWLTQICGTYVMMCTLGFETLSNEQIVRVLSCFHLIPDSDIVLSLLCVGEDNHREVERILKGWKEIGGKVYMVRPILEEVAYHAWISEYDYGSFGQNLAIISDHEARRLIDNAFVRAFRKEAGDLTGKQYWNEYIKQYKGHTELDYAYIMEHLRDDYGFGFIAENIDANKEFIDGVHRFLVEQLCQYYSCQPSDLDNKMVGKAKRDSRLVSTVLKERNEAHAAGESRTYCVVSSARLLKEVDSAFRNDLGEPEMVLSIAAMGFLLTLTPQVQMGFNTLRSILFDTYLATKLTSAQRLAYRVIASTGKWDLPWSRRGTLQRELGRTLYEQARLRGQPVKKIREKFHKADDAEFSAQILASTLEKMAISPKSSEEIARLRAEIEKLRERLIEGTKVKKLTNPISKDKPKQFRRRRK